MVDTYYIVFFRSVNVTLPRKTRNNGSLFVHVFVYPRGMTPYDSYFTSYDVIEQTQYALPKDDTLHLLSSDSEKKVQMPITYYQI